MPAPPRAPGKPIAAIVSLVFGLLPIPFWLAALAVPDAAGIAFIVTIAAGVVAIVTGAVGISQAKNRHLAVGGMGMAIAGLSLGVLGVVAGVVALVVVLIIFATCLAACASCGQVSTAGAALAAANRSGRPPRGWRSWLAHHPEGPAYDHDVFRVMGVRLCVGCFTAVPVFAVAWTALVLTGPHDPALLLAAGAALGAVQLWSTFGRARTRGTKVVVKTFLGAGLASFAAGYLALPLGQAAQMLVALAFVGLGWLSTLPRARRMGLD